MTIYSNLRIITIFLIVFTGIIRSCENSEVSYQRSEQGSLQRIPETPIEDEVTYSPIMDLKYPGMSLKRKLAYPSYTIVTSGGIKWALYTTTIMWGNQYVIYEFPASVLDPLSQCLADCIANTQTASVISYFTPASSGVDLPKTCNSCDWWNDIGQCHHSYGTSCYPSPGHIASATAFYYEKFCVCGLTANSLASKTYDFSAPNTDMKVYDKDDAFTNAKPTECPITGCVVLQNDCQTALAPPMNSYIFTKSSSPWALAISQTKPLGYPITTFCYSCSNSQQTITTLVTIRQKIDCTLALNGNSTSYIKDFNDPQQTHYSAIAFQNTPQYKSLAPYLNANNDLFSNVNAGDCGGFTACSVKPIGCMGTYFGYAQIELINLGLTAQQNTDYGYNETLCVECQNAAGAVVQHDNWNIQQLMNCGIALRGNALPIRRDDYLFGYLDTTAKVQISTSEQDFFTNPYAWECGAITGCTIMNQGCSSVYFGTNIHITSTLGQFEASQNVDLGYNETICIQCQNSAGSIENFDNWLIQQQSNCAIEKASIKPNIGLPYSQIGNVTYSTDGIKPIFSFDYFYWSGYIYINGQRYVQIDLTELKKLFVMNKPHCESQLASWLLYDDDQTTPLVSNFNITIQNNGNMVAVSTENFNWNKTIYLQNFLFYGNTSYLASVQLKFKVTNCVLVKIKFSYQIPKNRNYGDVNGFPYQRISQLVSNDSDFKIAHDMTVAFESEDPTNCPVLNYKIEKTLDYKFNIERKALNSFVLGNITIGKITGLFTLQETKMPLQWFVWLSATGQDGIKSGLSTSFNIMIDLFIPPPIIRKEAEFKFGVNDEFKQNQDGSYSVTKYIQTYANLTWFEEPNLHPKRKVYAYTLPEIIDFNNVPTYQKLVPSTKKNNGIDVTFMKNKTILDNGKLRFQILIDKSKMFAEESLIESCEKLALNKFSRVQNYFSICPTQSIEIKLYDEYVESPSFYFHFIFLYNDMVQEIEEFLKAENNKTKRHDKLTANITNIDQYRLVKVQFNQRLETNIFNVTRINSTDIPNLPRYLKEEFLQFGQNYMNISDINSTMLYLRIIPSDNKVILEDLEKSYNFSWEVVYLRWNFMYIQLNFTHPEKISSLKNLDTLELKVNKTYGHLFYSKEIDQFLDPDWYNLTHPISRQSVDEGIQHHFSLIAQILKKILLVAFWLTFLISGFLSGGLKWYFTLIRTLQIIIHLPMMNIVVPYVVIQAYSVIIPIAKWDVFDSVPWGPQAWFKTSGDDVNSNNIAQQWQFLGYNSYAVSANLGIFAFLWVQYLAKITLLVCIKMSRRSYGNQRRFQVIYLALLKQIFFIELFIIILEGYIEYLITAFLQDQKMPQIDPQIPQGQGKFYISIIMLMCFVFAPIAFIYQIINNINMHQMHKFNERYGSLFEGIDLRTRFNAAFYMVFCIRRVICVLLFFNLISLPGIQLVIFMLLNLTILIYTGYNQPLVGKLNNRLELFNEFSVCCVTFQMSFFTYWTLGYDIHSISEDLLLSTIDLIPVKSNKYGYLMNSSMFYFIYVNLLVVCYFTFRQVYLVTIKYIRIAKLKFCGISFALNKYKQPKNMKNFKKRFAARHFEKKKSQKFYGVYFYKQVDHLIKLQKSFSLISENSEQETTSPQGKFGQFMDKMQKEEEFQKNEVPQNNTFASFMDQLEARESQKPLIVPIDVQKSGEKSQDSDLSLYKFQPFQNDFAEETEKIIEGEVGVQSDELVFREEKEIEVQSPLNRIDMEAQSQVQKPNDITRQFEVEKLEEDHVLGNDPEKMDGSKDAKKKDRINVFALFMDNQTFNQH